MNISKTINHKELHPSKLVEVFVENHVYFPRVLRIEALRTAIESKYKDEKKVLDKKKEDAPTEMGIKEYGRLNRLEDYSGLSEYQLESDYLYYEDENLNEYYFRILWEKLIKHIDTYPNADKVFEDVSNIEKEENEVKMNAFEYNQHFKKLILDEDDHFDGIHLLKAVEHFDNTSAALEIRKLAEKYDIFVPKYWTKSDLQLKIKQELNDKKKLTTEMNEKIDTSSVKKLKILLEEMKLDAKLHITKADIIKIIIKNVDKNKVSKIAQVVEVVEFTPIAEVAPEPVIEVVEEVKPTPVLAPVVMTNEAIDYTDLLKQVILNQELIIKQLETKEDKKEQVDVLSPHFVERRKNKRMIDRVFNYIVIVLIVIVSLVWIYYGVTTLL